MNKMYPINGCISRRLLSLDLNERDSFEPYIHVSFLYTVTQLKMNDQASIFLGCCESPSHWMKLIKFNIPLSCSPF